MLQRVLFFSIVVFFATMNVLLWRVEFGGSSRLGSPVPVESVVRRILTAPDDSSLEIRRDGQRIGYCHWIAGAAEELVLETPAEMEGLPEGMVRRPQAYGVHLEGGILSGPAATRVRFSVEVKLDEEQQWREFILRLGTRPSEWEIIASADQRMVEVRHGPEVAGWRRQFKFEELREPRQWVSELAGPAVGALMPQLMQLPGLGDKDLELGWVARSDWMKVGGTRVQAYRLETKLLNRHEISILVSRVGEIMRVELPGGLSLVNEVLVNFGAGQGTGGGGTR